MILGPVFGVDGRRGTSAKALKASKGAGARISSDYLATPPVPKLASSGKGQVPLHVFDSRATHARTLLPAALASVPFGFVLDRVRVRVFRL